MTKTTKEQTLYDLSQKLSGILTKMSNSDKTTPKEVSVLLDQLESEINQELLKI
jgi:hypothetical protein